MRKFRKWTAVFVLCMIWLSCILNREKQKDVSFTETQKPESEEQSGDYCGVEFWEKRDTTTVELLKIWYDEENKLLRVTISENATLDSAAQAFFDYFNKQFGGVNAR